MHHLAALGAALSVRPAVLLVGDEMDGIPQDVSLQELVTKLTQVIANSGLTIDEWEGRVNWYLKPVVADPRRLLTYPVEGLYAICKAIGVDWVRALPTASSQL